MDKNFWDSVYSKKSEKEVSWFQEVPEKSLELIRELNLPKNARVIDIGGGDSRLADVLLTEGFSDISVLDISEVSLEKLRTRLGSKVRTITCDVTQFYPTEKYDLWHDRAAFHFLTALDEIEKYLGVVSDALSPGGNLIVSTFSTGGPDKCSGLPVHKYSQEELKAVFGKFFANTRCFESTHVTPWGSEQSFVYCGFTKL